MGSLVLELQRDALNPQISVLVLLRKALVVARKLNIQEFQQWVEKELNGYPGISYLPQYRFMFGDLKARNPYHGWIPVRVPSQIHEFISKQPVLQPISEIETLVESLKDKNASLITMPPALEEVLREYDDIPFEMQIHIDISQAKGVLEAVRDVVLSWSLKLEEDGILGEEMTFSPEEKQIAAKNDYSSFILINIRQSQMQNSSSESQSSSESFSNDLRGANVANFANEVSGNARQQANQHIHLSESRRTLAEAAEELQQILNQLEQTNPTATESEKVAYVNDETTPSFKRRVAGALQASGETAIDEFILENKYLKVVKSAIKGWLQPGG
ncbi:AbiTii domain-containing protein [Microcoleus sp. F4-D5]|uniref:AbiTii domain-containing protein n=1 Tax=Microcoleus sp. F4-D5 TaxID=2818760 RepID=UPI002FD4DF83